MNVWEIAILRCIKELGGVANLNQIYGKIGNFIDLKKSHIRETVYGGRPAFQHQVRSHITNLCQESELRWEARGRYSITDKGLKRIGRANA